MIPGQMSAPLQDSMRDGNDVALPSVSSRIRTANAAVAWAKSFSIYDELYAVFASFPEIFFIHNLWIGLAFFAVTMVNPGIGGAGLVAVMSAFIFARFLKMDREFLRSGMFTYNTLLVGLALGHKLQFTALSCILFATAGILTFMLAIAMSHLFSKYLRLPILSLPFVLVTWCAYLASYRYSNLLVSETYGHALWSQNALTPDWIAAWPPLLTGYFKSLGAILFEPNILVGMAIAILIAWKSRILFLLSLWGFYVGVAVRGLMFGNIDMAATDICNFNYILTAMVVGGVYTVPSIRSYLLAAVAVVASILIFDATFIFVVPFRLPAYTLPFNIATMAFIFFLDLLQSPLYARFIGRTPEETVENEYANRMRYHGQLRTLFLPFSGQWTVWQGFDGCWTHKGNWRHAYDFVITDDSGKTHSGDGSKLEDYYCFHKPVLSPVRGKIVRIVNDLPDLKPGEADKTNNWGNALVIQDLAGYYVEISHFAEKSIRVKVGDSVERGTVLGLCGNSGYSPQPHIHIQTQATDTIGAASLPFSFVSFVENGKYIANDIPAEKHVVEPLYPDKRMDAQTSFVLDEVYNYSVRRNGREIDTLKLTVRMSYDGTFYFDSGNGQLYFGKHEGTFYFYRADGNDKWLRAMLLALPRLPLSYRTKLAWNDFVPAGSAALGLKKIAAQLLSSFAPGFAAARVSQCFTERGVAQCRVKGSWFFTERRAAVTLDETKGFSLFKLDDIEIRRIEDEIKSPYFI